MQRESQSTKNQSVPASYISQRPTFEAFKLGNPESDRHSRRPALSASFRWLHGPAVADINSPHATGSARGTAGRNGISCHSGCPSASLSDAPCERNMAQVLDPEVSSRFSTLARPMLGRLKDDDKHRGPRLDGRRRYPVAGDVAHAAGVGR